MATILLVEDAPDLSLYEANHLEAAGHRVLRCGGSPAPYTPCPMLRFGDCPLPDAADLILFSCQLFAPMRGRRYNGTDLLRAYRAHPHYGTLPMVVVSVGLPQHLAGTGALVAIDKWSSPGVIEAAIEHALASTTPVP